MVTEIWPELAGERLKNNAKEEKSETQVEWEMTLAPEISGYFANLFYHLVEYGHSGPYSFLFYFLGESWLSHADFHCLLLRFSVLVNTK